jgi:hypothetical protein
MYGWLAADHVPNVFTVVLVSECLELHVMVPGVLHGLETRDRADVADVPRGAMHNVELHGFQKRSLACVPY